MVNQDTEPTTFEKESFCKVGRRSKNAPFQVERISPVRDKADMVDMGHSLISPLICM